MKSRAITTYVWRLLLALMSFLWLSCDNSNSSDQSAYFIKYYGLEGNQEGVDMIVNEDGTFYLFGNSTLPGKNQQLFLVKADAQGMMMWENAKFFGGGIYTNQARDIEVTTDGRLLLVATSESAEGDDDVLLIIADQDGNKLDSIKHGYKNGANEDASSVTQINDGYIVTGSTSKIKLNPLGQAVVVNDTRDIFNFRFTNQLKDYNIENNNTWTENFLSGTFDVGVKMIQATNNQFYFFGYSNQTLGKDFSEPANFDFVIHKVSEDGDVDGAATYVGSPSADERLTSVSISPIQAGAGYFLSGISSPVSGSGDKNIYIAKLNKDLNVQEPYQNIVYQKTFSLSLGNPSDLKASSATSVNSGYLILANENTAGNQNFSLTKATNEGSEIWRDPSRFAFGGAGLDQIGAVNELPDGEIVMIGTFSVGDDGQKKMTLIKVNKEGKFRD